MKIKQLILIAAYFILFGAFFSLYVPRVEALGCMQSLDCGDPSCRIQIVPGCNAPLYCESQAECGPNHCPVEECHAIVPPPPADDIFGCTDPGALNYDPIATADDGSCAYPPPPLPPPPPPPADDGDPLPPPADPFDYHLTVANPASGNVEVTKDPGSNKFGAAIVNSILDSGSSENVNLTITLPAAFPAGISVVSFSNQNCSPNCSSNITFQVAPNTAVGTIPVEITGQPFGKKTNFNLVIKPAPLAASCTANPSPALVGEEVIWTVNVVGGTPPYTYTWDGDGVPNNLDPNTQSFKVSYSTTGIKIVRASVTTSSGSIVCSNGNNNGLGEGGRLYVNFNPKLEEF